MSAIAADEITLPTFGLLNLTGLETVMFNEVGNLEHALNLDRVNVGTATGATTPMRVVNPNPIPTTLILNHVVMSDKSLFDWMDAVVKSYNGTVETKEGTLELVDAGSGVPVKSWKLANVYLTYLGLGPMGANSAPILQAQINLLCGSCTPA